MKSLESSFANEQKENVQDSFVIAESGRPIPFTVKPNELKPNLGTIRLLASASNEKEPVGVLIQVMKDGRPRLSFAVPREDIMRAGDVFDTLTYNPYTKKGVDRPQTSDPLTEEKIAETFKTVARISRLQGSHPSRDDVRQSVLTIISQGVAPLNATSSGKNEGAPSLEARLMQYIEATLRVSAPPEQKKASPTVKEQIVDAGTKLADNLMHGPTEERRPPEPGNF